MQHPAHLPHRTLRLAKVLHEGFGAPMWQKRLLQWLTQWEWADGLDLPYMCITWLELFIGYELDTDTELPMETITTDRHAAHLEKRAGLGILVNAFKRAVTQLVQSRLTADCRNLFRQGPGDAKQKSQRLLAAGITGQWMTVATHPAWPNSLRHRVHLALLKQRGIQAREESGLGQGPHLANAGPLQRTKLPMWRTTKPDEKSRLPVVTAQNCNAVMEGYLVLCKHCKATNVLADKPLHHSAIASVIKCAQCSRRVTTTAMICALCNYTVSKRQCHIGQLRKRQSSLERFGIRAR